MKKELYKKIDIKIEPVGVCDIYEVGNWTNCYPWIKLGYKVDEYQSKYSDVSFCIKSQNIIFGYLMAYSVVNVNDDIIPIYHRKLVLYDFAISSKAYAKYGSILINYLINFAVQNGYKAIEINKNSEYSFFLNFLNRHYHLKEFKNNLYIIIDNPRIKLSQKHLTIYEKDKIKIEELYFLHDLKFAVQKTIVKLKLNNRESIIVNRINGKITFPSNVTISKDEVILNSYTRNIIFLVSEMYRLNQVKNIVVNYDKTKPELFEVYDDDHLYVNKNTQVLINEIDYVLAMIDKGIKYINSYIIEYNMNDRTFASNLGDLKCDSIIEKYASNCDSKANNSLEKINEKKKTKEFNSKLKTIQRFDFRFGDSFCGIKKLAIIFDNDVDILSNGEKENNIRPNKDEIIKELGFFNFTNWKNKYDNNNSPKFENTWSIKLYFEDERLEFVGFDDYPKIWEYVEWFINKYSKFHLIKE